MTRYITRDATSVGGAVTAANIALQTDQAVRLVTIVRDHDGTFVAVLEQR